VVIYALLSSGNIIFSAARGTAQPNDFHGPHAMIWQKDQGLGKTAV